MTDTKLFQWMESRLGMRPTSDSQYIIEIARYPAVGYAATLIRRVASHEDHDELEGNGETLREALTKLREEASRLENGGATRERLGKLIDQDPGLSTTQLGKRLGISRKRVHDLLKELGYQSHQEWRKASPPAGA